MVGFGQLRSFGNQVSDNEQAPEPAVRLGLELLYSAPCDGGQPGPLVEYACPNGRA